MVFDQLQMEQWIREQTDLGPRRAGTAAGQQQEDNLVAKLRSFGIKDVRKEPIDVVAWEPKEAKLEVIAENSKIAIPCFPIPYAAFTNQDLHAPFIWAEDRRLHLDDWKGAIVAADIHFPMLDAAMLRKISLGEIDLKNTLQHVRHPATWVRLGWHHYLNAVARGAAGFVGILRDQPGGNCRMYAPYGFREKNILDKPVPGVWVSKANGEQLKSLALHRSHSAMLHTSGTRKQSVTHNIVAEIPGESSEAMLITCHHDSPFRSPVEDASGIAAVLAIAQAVAKAKPLKRRLIILLTAGHFYGSIGTRTFIAKHRNSLLPNLAFALSIEHIAKEAAEDESGNLVATGLSEAAGIFISFSKALREAVFSAASKTGIDRWVILPADGPLGNYPPTDGGDWYAAGIPITNYISNPVYLLTDDDADQWVNADELPRVAATFYNLLLLMDHISIHDLKKIDYPFKRFFMKLLRIYVQLKSTRMGRRPLH